ncbi:unnamed protein product [Caenorhabditis nigoni]
MEKWTSTRKYSIVVVVSLIVHKWGLETRDFILREVFELLDPLLSLINIKASQSESEILMLQLVDDVIKLSMIETVDGHRSMNEKTEENVRKLVKFAIRESLKSLNRGFSMSPNFQISDEICRFLARWFLAERRMDTVEMSLDESSLDSKSDGRKFDENYIFSLEGLIHLSFGSNCVNKHAAWNGAMQILNEILKANRLNSRIVESIVSILWEKRKSYTSEYLRTSFCALLATVIPQGVRFGHFRIPSIDSILKYTLSLMPNVTSLPNAAILTENILKFRPKQVSKDAIRLIWDTVSRTSPACFEVLRLLSALVSFTEFEENSRFANDENVGKWSLRKDVIEWLLIDPSAHSHQLIRELCHYHPAFCYETDEPNTDDQLLRNLKMCHLIDCSSSTVLPHTTTVTQMRPTDAKIEEIVNYVDCKLKSMLSTELTLPIFVLSYEFSLKFPEVSFDFDLIYKRLPHLLQDLEPSEFLESIQNFSEWPEFLEFPPKFVPNFDCLMTYFLKNVENQLIDMTKKWETNPGKIVETLADYCRKWPKMREKMCKSMPFNRLVKNWILETEGDPYEMSNRFEKYSFLLSYRHLLITRETILARANNLLVAQSVTPQDVHIFEKLLCSSSLRNLVPPRRVIGPSFDVPTVALYPKNLEFDQRSVKFYLKRLKKSPFLAQNIVRTILNDDTWHLHATVLKIVMEDEQFLTVCIATIPNMVRYLKMYQIHFPPKSLSVRFLNLDKSSIKACQKYLRKPKENGHLISPINLITLFGCEKSTWKRMILQFWRQFEREPALVAERLYEFASESVDLGLQTRVVCILRALTSSEYCRTVLQDEQLKMAFDLTYRAIWMVLVKNQCSPEILELCDDAKLRNDLFGHRTPQIPSNQIDEFRLYEMRIAFSVENFLKFGIESGEDTVDFMDFGLAEFYKQLNENLTEEAIRGNEKRNIYIVDILSTVWLRLPWLRPHIQPIIARFKHISPAWKSFPQPPHLPATEHTFKWKCHFHLTLKFMNFWNQKTSEGEFATCILIMLTSHGGRKHLKTNLIEPKQLIKLKNGTRRNVLCVLAKILRKETSKEDDIEEEVIEEAFFEALTQSAAIFPDIATFTIPFLFHLCVDFKQKVDLGMSKLLSSLKGTPKDNQTVVFCLAECVDSVGLDSLARYESVDPEEPLQYATMWFFVMARLFLEHGYLTHAFAVANVLFDRLSSKKRNTMMIERISLEQIDKSEEMIELLVDIYVAEDNSTALSTLPPGVQNRPNVRKVMNKKQKEWMRLVSTAELDPREATILQWLCGLPSARSNNDIYLDSILRGRFTEYPKILDTPLKFVYFSLFHTALGTKISESVVEKKLQNPPTLLETRLMMLANGTANFEPESIEEHVIQAVRDVREAEFWRASSTFEKASEVNEKTKRMVLLAELLVENHAYDAAMLILKSWEEECLQWRVPSIDIDLIRIAGESVTCQAGDPRTAEINLRQMAPGKMSEAAIAEWCIVLSKITIDYRNDDVEGIRILERGCRHLEHKTCVESRLKVLLQFHSICMGQLSKLEEYLETRSFRMKKQVIAEYEKQIEKKNSTPRVQRGTSGGDEMKRTERVKKEMRLEKADVEKVEGLVVSAARKAVQSAFQALSCISQLEDDEEAIRTSSLIVFPLIDVIYKYETDPGVVEALKGHSKTALPSKLWLCATSHLASKCFAVEKTPISRYLSQILCHLVYDYPYHVLHTILMYEFDKNGAQVREFLRSMYSVKTKRDVDKLREVVAMMREAHVAYREIAKLQVKENIRIQRVERDGKTMLVWPRDLKIFKCKLDQLPIPTISQKIGAPGDLSTSNLITWRDHKDVFSLADGLSSPIIWEIQGSDGRWYKTVWKKEDVRQDVLVEQMFDVTNNMLEKRALRTYNVVPLDTECGIIEFCGGSVSLKELLCGTNREGGLHKEMCSDEPTATQASRMMKEVQSDTSEMRRRVFVEVCQQYSPVFRHFFYRQFPTAHIWRQKIDTYRRSLATWSVVCYIVGLGDRHASNILFDQKECTFVHIDLGMILEYSKRSLPVPEQVPFRITRDVLDPLLIEGIENGRLAEDCTKIMEKLKQNNKVILGVASAILRETMSNFREAEQSSGRPSYISEMAIGRLRDKLRGTDDGVTAQSSNLQIRRLLRDATSSDNLSRMFFGWMPFL